VAKTREILITTTTQQKTHSFPTLHDTLNTKQHHSELTAVGNNYGLGGPATGGAHTLDGLDNVKALNHLTEHHMLPIQPLCFCSTDKELGPVSVLPGVCHRQDSRPGVLLREILVGELGTVDGLTAGAVPGREIPSLAHEARDHTVESGTLEVQRLPGFSDTFLAGAQCSEVLCRLRRHVGEKFHHDSSGGCAPDGHVEENLRVWHFSRFCESKAQPLCCMH